MRLASLQTDVLGGMTSAAFEQTGPGPWSLRLVPLDGVVTESLARYGALAARLDDASLAGVDVSLSYEVSETVLGLVDASRAQHDAALMATAEDLFNGYLGFYARGTQTRSLATGVRVALELRYGRRQTNSPVVAELVVGTGVESDAGDTGTGAVPSKA